MSIRAEHAELTRRAIIDVARQRFAQYGYAATTVEQIARGAHVTPKTVYAVTGGKRGLLHAVVQPWAEAEVVDVSLGRMHELTTGRGVLALAARTSRMLWEQERDVIALITEAARQDQTAANALQSAYARIRRNVEAVTEHLQSINELAPGLAIDRAADILWFHIRPHTYFELIGELGWTASDTERFVVEQLSSALLP